jgi:hypothetical protein
MSETPITASLSQAEFRLIEAIRALPDSTLQKRTHEVLGELLFFVQNPRCQGIGAEGFPCGEPVSTCEECHQVWDLLDGIAARLKVPPAV